MSRDIKVSVIIPTYNGAHKIVSALESLSKQTCVPEELIVVIDGSTDNTYEVVAAKKSILPALQILQQENQGRAGVRNTGAKAASNELLLFLDDDMIVPPNWIEMHKAHHQKYPGSLVSGRLEQMLITQEETEFDVFEKWQNGRWNKTIADTKTDEIELTTAYVTANNFSIAKTDFDALGMFDIRLKDAEDYDLAMKAKEAHKPIYLSNLCWAWHNDVAAKNFLSYIKRLREYNKAQYDLIKINPEVYGNPQKNVRYPLRPSGIKTIFFKFFVNRFFVFSLDKKFWRFLPIPIRCKLYDYVLTSNGVYFPTVNL